MSLISIQHGADPIAPHTKSLPVAVGSRGWAHPRRVLTGESVTALDIRWRESESERTNMVKLLDTFEDCSLIMTSVDIIVVGEPACYVECISLQPLEDRESPGWRNDDNATPKGAVTYSHRLPAPMQA